MVKNGLINTIDLSPSITAKLHSLIPNFKYGCFWERFYLNAFKYFRFAKSHNDYQQKFEIFFWPDLQLNSI